MVIDHLRHRLALPCYPRFRHILCNSFSSATVSASFKEQVSRELRLPVLSSWEYTVLGGGQASSNRPLWWCIGLMKLSPVDTQNDAEALRYFKF